MKKLLLLIPLLSQAKAQSIHITGGDSSLMNASGGAITAYFPNHEFTFGSGLYNSNFGFGISDKTKWKGLKWTLGDSSFNYSVDGTGVNVFLRGVQVAKEREDGKRVFGALIGDGGLSYIFPFFTQFEAKHHPSAGVFYRQKFGNWRFSSLDIFSGSKNSLQSILYDGKKLRFNSFGGILRNQWIAGATVVFKPVKDFQLGGNYQQQIGLKNESAYASYNFRGLTCRASYNQGTYSNAKAVGESFGISETWKWLTISSNYYNSNHHQQVLNSLMESFRHWMITESISASNQYQFGVVYHRNNVGFSFQHQIYFLPGYGYQQVLQMGVSFHIHDSDIQNQSYILPDKIGFKQTTYAGQWIQGPFQGSAIGHTPPREPGRFAFSGTVNDVKGFPVQGACIRLGKDEVYTGIDGKFQLRTKKLETRELLVNISDFLVGRWELIAAPTQIASGDNTTIIVKRK